MKKPRVCFVHDYLIQYGGAEKTLEALLEMYPDSPVYTGIYKKEAMSEIINRHKIISPRGILLKTTPKLMTMFMPLAFENFDLSAYDIIISDGNAWSKGVLTQPDQLHISYVHTPPRFLYKYSVESQKRNKFYFKPFVSFIDAYLRTWDYSAAQRPDHLIANSITVRNRIRKFYRRDAQVIYPPVEISFKNPSKIAGKSLQNPYYLALGRLAAYKNFDLLIEAFNLSNLPLVIAGTGKEERNLKRKAKGNIKFTGKVTEEEKKRLFANSLGFIFPVVDEDFGIVPIEAMSYGKPVLAHRSGGPTETIKEGITGTFFDEIDIEHFIKALKSFDNMVRKGSFDPEIIQKSVRTFNKERFQKEFSNFVKEKWDARTA